MLFGYLYELTLPSVDWLLNVLPSFQPTDAAKAKPKAAAGPTGGNKTTDKNAAEKKKEDIKKDNNGEVNVDKDADELRKALDGRWKSNEIFVAQFLPLVDNTPKCNIG